MMHSGNVVHNSKTQVRVSKSLTKPILWGATVDCLDNSKQSPHYPVFHWRNKLRSDVSHEPTNIRTTDTFTNEVLFSKDTGIVYL